MSATARLTWAERNSQAVTSITAIEVNHRQGLHTATEAMAAIGAILGALNLEAAREAYGFDTAPKSVQHAKPDWPHD